MQLALSDEAALERVIEARVAARCEAESWRWKFKLVSIETLMMGALIIIAGLLLHQPLLLVLRASLMVAASCFASGILLLSLSGLTARMIKRLRRWRQS